MPLSNRSINSLIVVAVIGLMGYALYSQYVDGLEPCPLCMTQRIFYCLTGAIALLAALHNPRGWGARVYGVLIALSAAAGAAAAGRQVWLQHLPPDQVPACGPSLEYMLETFPFSHALKMLVLGDGNCALVDWVFLGLSMAEWSLLWLLALVAAGAVQALRR
ncbi:MAG TPA: disulfide bond formation protein B [Spongiibacteraceae bacterium]|jgi:disulfide bond formation protein DsbB|nr:disulfide bond formation protein B [Spongiibacteraceae bacterium]HUH36715.1 disulfide bond formation protein B [Spongiibacteraceae bacterium]